MQVKKFEAKTMEEALSVIKRELGPEAIILSTKENKRSFGLLKRPSVEITAAISERALLKKKIAESKMKEELKEKIQNSKSQVQAQTYDRFAKSQVARDAQKEAQKKKLHNPKKKHLTKRYVDIMDGDEEKDLFAVSSQAHVVLPKKVQIPLTRQKDTPPKSTQHDSRVPALSVDPHETAGDIGLLKEHLLWVGVNPDIATQIVKVVHSDNEIWRAIRKESISTQMRSLIPIVLNYIRIGRPISDDNLETRKFYSFIGPTGSGKTSTIAKVAARLKMQRRQNIGLVTLDVFRIGGVDHLKSYGKLLGFPVITVDRPENILNAVAVHLPHCDTILIDTPGCSEIDLERLGHIQKALNTLPQVQRFLVTSVTQPVPLRRMIENAGRYGGIRFDGHIFTKLDETDVRGDILNRAYCSKRPVFYLSKGQQIPNDLEVASREIIGKLVFHQYSWELER